ncbi:uncharacterized protein LOC110986358 [Acanthaster planci]|uniref:Uncharacterized protein LOC110986358 n=1 Tax=Acanthaster planci TaxID=133434 RepID=A0A8B7ZDW7_ACAPL|nr:uncharacterized protein LOC110986358 [Acanthaster planci]
MASTEQKATAQSVLEKISQGHLECSICSDRFREPKVLDCLHSFCLKCLQRLRQSQHPQDVELECPICRRKTTIKGDICDLPTDFKLSALVDEVNMQETLLEGQRSEIKCQACDEENQALSRCMDCDHFLCKECQRAHKRMISMKSHTIYTLAQLQSGEVTYKSKIREYTPKCMKHPDQSLSIYCTECKKLVCTTCAILDHDKHPRIGLPEALDKCKQDIANISEKAERNKTKLKAYISEVDKTDKDIKTMYENTSKKISIKADMEVAKIREKIEQIRGEQSKLKQEADTIFKDRAKVLETTRATNVSHVTMIENKLEEVNRFVAQASCYEILDFSEKLLHNLGAVIAEGQPKILPHCMSSFMDFEEGTGRSLGKLVLKDEKTLKSDVTAPRSQTSKRWELKTEITTYGHQNQNLVLADEIGSLSNNEMVVLERGKNKLITFRERELYPNVISEELQLEGLRKPSHVSVNSDDEIIVLDGTTVKIFNIEKKPCLHQFQPGEETNSTPTCLAVEGGDVIAVGYRDKEQISLHRRDGTLIRRLRAPMIGDNLTLLRKQQQLISIIYSINTEVDGKLLSVDCYGRIVFAVDIPSNIQGPWHANGLCCDKDGYIYVTIHGKPLQGEIQQFDPNGHYIGCVLDKCGYPGDITFTPAGELVLATWDSIKVYHQV